MFHTVLFYLHMYTCMGGCAARAMQYLHYNHAAIAAAYFITRIGASLSEPCLGQYSRCAIYCIYDWMSFWIFFVPLFSRNFISISTCTCLCVRVHVYVPFNLVVGDQIVTRFYSVMWMLSALSTAHMHILPVSELVSCAIPIIYLACHCIISATHKSHTKGRICVVTLNRHLR